MILRCTRFERFLSTFGLLALGAALAALLITAFDRGGFVIFLLIALIGPAFLLARRLADTALSRVELDGKGVTFLQPLRRTESIPWVQLRHFEWVADHTRARSRRLWDYYIDVGLIDLKGDVVTRIPSEFLHEIDKHDLAEFLTRHLTERKPGSFTGKLPKKKKHRKKH